ncbi:uncharacterized protein LOC107303932 [Oryza brachyantha]|uniref:uncharacterized protein LOC107303932 n=1 Tax=Oryza brachyantha TaxID=4533 RepID=UPI0007763BA9|nr:uncharacterized protein LOC107303932 [Oryza brachyantha]
MIALETLIGFGDSAVKKQWICHLCNSLNYAITTHHRRLSACSRRFQPQLSLNLGQGAAILNTLPSFSDVYVVYIPWSRGCEPDDDPNPVIAKLLSPHASRCLPFKKR